MLTLRPRVQPVPLPLRQVTDQIIRIPNGSPENRLFCERAFFLSPPGYGTRKLVGFDGGIVCHYSDGRNAGTTIIGKDPIGNTEWVHSLAMYPPSTRLWIDLGLSENGQTVWIRVFDKLEVVTNGKRLRAAIVALDVRTGAMEEVPSADGDVPTDRFVWIGGSRFVHVSQTRVEVWAIENQLRRQQIHDFKAPMDGFQVFYLSPDEIALVHCSAPTWYVGNIRTGRFEARALASPVLAEMQERAAKSHHPETAPAHLAIGTDRRGTLFVVGGLITASDAGGFPLVAIKPDGKESVVTVQMPAVNRVGCTPFKLFGLNGEVAIFGSGDTVSWYKVPGGGENQS